MPEPRSIPASVEAEAGLLGALLLDNQAIHRMPPLDTAAFYKVFHAEVYGAIQALAEAGQPYDVITVHAQMRSQGLEPDLLALNDLAQYVPSSTNIRRFADIVADRYRARQLMEAGSAIAELAMTPGAALGKVDEAQMLLAKLATVKARREPQHILQSLPEHLQLLEDRSNGKDPAMATGIGGFDKLLSGGLRKGEVMVLGARPKHGKTALALAMARNMAKDHRVLFLSQEMPISQLMNRHIAAAGTIELSRVLAPKPEDETMWEAVADASRRLGDLHLLHDDQSSLSLMDVRRKAIKVRREHGLDVLFVDFLQLMAGGGGEESRNREIDIIANGMKALALDLSIAVVLLSQLSRKADEYYGRPQMPQLRDSGTIEAAADVVAMLFTDWAHPLSKRLPDFQGFAELEIVAHRNGPHGVVPLEFIGRYQQIGEWLYELPTHKVSVKSPAAKF